MNITIHIENATQEVLSVLANLDKKTTITAPQITHSLVTVPKFCEQNGLKKDGNPTKKRGRPVGTTKKVLEAKKRGRPAKNKVNV